MAKGERFRVLAQLWAAAAALWDYVWTRAGRLALTAVRTEHDPFSMNAYERASSAKSARLIVGIMVGGAVLGVLAIGVVLWARGEPGGSMSDSGVARAKEIHQMVKALAGRPLDYMTSEAEADFALPPVCTAVPLEATREKVIQHIEARSVHIMVTSPWIRVFCPQHYRVPLCMLSLHVNDQFIHLYNPGNATMSGSVLPARGQSIMFDDPASPAAVKRGTVRGVFRSPRFTALELSGTNRTSGESIRLKLTGEHAIYAQDCLQLMAGSVAELLEVYPVKAGEIVFGQQPNDHGAQVLTKLERAG